MGGNVPKEYVPGVLKGLNSAMTTGTIAGYPMIDFKAVLIDGAYHDVDSSTLAFEIAARAALRASIQTNEAGPRACPDGACDIDFKLVKIAACKVERPFPFRCDVGRCSARNRTLPSRS